MGKPVRNLAWLAKHHFGTLRWLSFIVCLGPALWLSAEGLTGSLGVNPLNRLLQFSGRWALILLSVTLGVTPLRRASVWVSQTAHARYGKRVSDWNWLIRLRRQFGLFTFFYAGLHLAVYVAFDAGPDLEAIRDDMVERPFILAGFVGFVLLLPLAATSHQRAIRALGRLWRRLHMLSYLIAVLAIVHFGLQMKLGETRALPYALVLAVLLGSRLHAWWRGERSAGAEVRQR